jgi:hydroxypyruvate isomerase
VASEGELGSDSRQAGGTLVQSRIPFLEPIVTTDPLLISAADWCFLRPGTEPAAWYRTLRSLGVSGIEMTAPANRAAARDAGLTLLNASGPGMQRGLNRMEHHADLLPAIGDAITAAAVAGVPAVIVFAGNRAGQAHGDGIAACIAGLRHLVPQAEAAGVTMLFELLNSYDHVDFAADHTGYGVEVVAGVGSPRVRLLYDIYHMTRMGQDVARDLATYSALIGHIHIAASPRRDVPRPGAAPDYAPLVAIARAANYRGYWGLEFLPGADPAADIAATVALLRGTPAQAAHH